MSNQNQTMELNIPKIEVKTPKWDFPVERRRIKTVDGLNIPDKYAIVRTDTNHVFGIASKKYEILKHTEAVELAEEALKNLGNFEKGKTRMAGNGARLYQDYIFPPLPFVSPIIISGPANDNYAT